MLNDLPDELIFLIYSKVLIDILNSDEFKRKQLEVISKKMSIKQRLHLYNYFNIEI